MTARPRVQPHGSADRYRGTRGYKHGLYSRVARNHVLPSVQRQLEDYCVRTLFTILRARFIDADHLNEVRWYVFGGTGLIGYLDLADDGGHRAGADRIVSAASGWTHRHSNFREDPSVSVGNSAVFGHFCPVCGRFWAEDGLGWGIFSLFSRTIHADKLGASIWKNTLNRPKSSAKLGIWSERWPRTP